jgi:hypothetical protein
MPDVLTPLAVTIISLVEKLDVVIPLAVTIRSLAVRPDVIIPPAITTSMLVSAQAGVKPRAAAVITRL